MLAIATPPPTALCCATTATTRTSHTALVQAAYTVFRQRHELSTETLLLDLYTTNPTSTLAALPDKTLRTHIRAAASSDRQGVVMLLLTKAHTVYPDKPRVLQAHYGAALAIAAASRCVRTIAWLLAPPQRAWLDDSMLHNATLSAVSACIDSLHCSSNIFACCVHVLEMLMAECGGTIDRDELARGLQRRGGKEKACASAARRKQLHITTQGTPWSPTLHPHYPPRFHHAARALLCATTARSVAESDTLPRLPPEVMLCVLRHAASPMHVWLTASTQ